MNNNQFFAIELSQGLGGHGLIPVGDSDLF